MKACFAVLMLLAAGTGHATQHLKTDSFDITIDNRCAEGVVGCDDIRYKGIHRRSGNSISLVGREQHTRCADGVTPCRFLGYLFRNGATTYFVDAQGRLLVRQGERILVQEEGTWQ